MSTTNDAASRQAPPTPQEAKAILNELARPFLHGPEQELKRPEPSDTLARQDVSRFKHLESLFGSLPDALPDPLIVVNQQGLIVLANRHTADMFGYDHAELIGAPVELLIPSRFRRDHVGYRSEYFKAPKQRPMGAALRLFGVRKDGTEFPVEVSLNPLSTSEGLVVTSTIRDISERVRLEKRYRTLIEGIPAVTFMAALDAGVSELYVSPQIEKLLGFTQQEWLEDPILWYRQLHPDDQARWHGEFARTCATGGPFRAEYRFIARDGRVVWVLGQAKVVFSDDGRPLFMQGIAFDITAMKQAEEQLLSHQQDLERLVHERTIQLEEKAQKLEKYGSFVAHELRKPLNRMIDEARERLDLAQGKKNSPLQELSGWVSDKAQDMLVMIDRMLRWARVADRNEKRLVPSDCSAVFASACKKLKDAIAATHARVTCSPLPTVLAAQPDDREDWPELVLLFENLINNALKYRSPERPPEIRVEARRVDEEWVFSFADNGIGIESQYFDRIFELFKRLHPQHRIPGHGIGLAYCKRVVESLGGKMWVTSEFGKGSTFSFTLPALPGAADSVRSPDGTAPADAEPDKSDGERITTKRAAARQKKPGKPGRRR
jgi:PAS domain S-box-containing protein